MEKSDQTMAGALKMQSHCHICGSNKLAFVSGFEHMALVSSDVRACNTSMMWGRCQNCGTLQKILDAAWHEEIARIYKTYSIYHQSSTGSEPLVFNSSGEILRSRQILRKIMEVPDFPEMGRLLDVGCGNGGLLRAASTVLPKWNLFGIELHDTYRETILSIPNVEDFFVGSLDAVIGTFDLITMQHVLEHIEGPCDFVARLQRFLSPGGRILIQVPNLIENPFDLVIADHSSHFSPDTLRQVVERAGFEIEYLDSDSVPKEISLATRHWRMAPTRLVPFHRAESPEPSFVLDWLNNFTATAKRAISAHVGQVGIFGTSIAALWLKLAIGDKISFLLDDDQSRVGHRIFGLPVYHPSAAPADSIILIPLAPKIAQAVAQRLVHNHAEVVTPPPFRYGSTCEFT